MMNPVFRISRQAAKVVEKVLFENFEKNAAQLPGAQASTMRNPVFRLFRHSGKVEKEDG